MQQIVKPTQTPLTFSDVNFSRFNFIKLIFCADENYIKYAVYVKSAL